MNTYFIVSAIMLLIIGINHSTLGEKFIVVPLLKVKDMPGLFGDVVLMRRIIRFSWHLTSFPWWTSAYLLYKFAGSDIDYNARLVLYSIAAYNLANTVVIAAVSRGKHFSWPIFLAITVCIWLGLN